MTKKKNGETKDKKAIVERFAPLWRPIVVERRTSGSDELKPKPAMNPLKPAA